VHGVDTDTRLASSIETVHLFGLFALIEMAKKYKKD